jgi:hypothetical protein
MNPDPIPLIGALVAAFDPIQSVLSLLLKFVADHPSVFFFFFFFLEREPPSAVQESTVQKSF